MKSIVSRISLVYLMLLWIIPTIDVSAEVPGGFTVTQTNHDNMITFKGTLTEGAYRWEYTNKQCKPNSGYPYFDCLNNPHKFIKNLKSPKDLNFDSCEAFVMFQRYNNTLGNDKGVRRHFTTTMPCTFVGANQYMAMGIISTWGQKFYCTINNSQKGIVAARIDNKQNALYTATVVFTDCTDEKIIDKVYQDNWELIFYNDTRKNSLERYWFNED